MDPRIVFLISFSASSLSQKTLVTQTSSHSDSLSNNLGIYKGNPTTIEKHNCTGAVLNNDVFLCEITIVGIISALTSADCVYGWDTSQLSVVVGSDDGVNGQKHNVSNIIIHPKYKDTSTLDYNIAILIFTDKIILGKEVGICNITDDCPKAGTSLCTAGWGDTSPQVAGDAKTKFREGCMTVQTTKFCKNAYKDYPFRWNNRLSCLYNKGNTTLCKGDWSNGFLLNESGVRFVHFIFIAVSSSGFCSSDASPIICTKLCSVYPWLKKNLP